MVCRQGFIFHWRFTIKEDVSRVNQILPKATMIAVHMEAINHCVLSRQELKEYVNEKGIPDNVRGTLDLE